MGKFRPKQGGGSSNALCTASAAEVLSGYQAITRDSPIPQVGTLAATGNAEAGNVLSGKTFYAGNFKNKLTGTMVDRGQSQYAEGFDSGNDYVSFTGIPQGWYHQDKGSGLTPEIRMNRDTFKSNVIDYFGIASVANFSVAQYSSQTLLFTWANPGSGKMWSGIRIVGKQGDWPSSVSDGTVICDSAAGSYITGALATGTWYFRAWSYVTVNNGRWYGEYVQASIYNSAISGEKTFTYSQNWTVPAAVRRIQYFIVGTGGGGFIHSSNSRSRRGNGGGGGYTATGYADVTPGQVLSFVVGSGAYASDGGASYINGIASASGGKLGNSTANSGCGGSGGGGTNSSSSPNNGGSDGGSGGGVNPGWGQGSSTRCPWDSVLYSGGGGGGDRFASNCGAGGNGGGGAGGNGSPGQTSSTSPANNGTANTGGGGGGIGKDDNDGSSGSTCGGSGIIRIRW